MGLPTDCPADCGFAAWRWTQRWFGDCVCSGRDAASFTLGAASVLAWGVAELPQILANFRNGSSEGVSFAFVATWLTGDALNLIGCAVSPSLPTQMYTALVYTSTTVVLIAQHVAYGRRGEGDAIEKKKTKRDASPLEARLLDAEHETSLSVAPTRTREGTRDGSREEGFLFDETHDVEALFPATNTRESEDGGFVSDTEEAFARGSRPIRRAPNDMHTARDAPLKRQSVEARSLSSARTFVSGSWSVSETRRRSSSVGLARPSIGETVRAANGGGGGSRSERIRARRRSEERRGSFSSSATSAALAAALGVAACVAAVISVSVTVSSYAERSGTSGTSLRGGGSVPEPHAMDRVAPNDAFRRTGLLSASDAATRGGGDGADGYAHEALVPAPAWVGQALGWTMTLIYLGGRVPQIALNHARGSVEGLSVTMFLLAVTGNATYFASILARSTRWPRVRPNLPWLVDAALCLSMDAVILWQYSRYSRFTGEDSRDRERDGIVHERRDSDDSEPEPEPGETRGANESARRGSEDDGGTRGVASRTRRGSRDGDANGGLRVGYVALSGSEGSETWEGEDA